MANRRLIRPPSLLSALVAIVLLAGCTAQYEGPLPGTPVVTPSTPAPTATVTVAKDVPRPVESNANCQAFSIDSGKVDHLRRVADELGFGLMQEGFLLTCEQTDDPKNTTKLVQWWTKADRQSIAWELSEDPELVSTLSYGFIGVDGNYWSCFHVDPLDQALATLANFSQSDPGRLGRLGCTIPGRN